MGPKSQNAIEDALEHLATTLRSLGIGYQIKLLCNEEFAAQVVDQVLIDRNAIDDTAHLFLRTLQCLDAAGYGSQIQSMIREPDTEASPASSMIKTEGMPIGRYVQQSFDALVSKGLIGPSMVKNLTDPEYCRTVFGLGHPMLRENTATTADERTALRTDQNGYRRYWVEERSINKRSYFLCQEWYDRQRHRYEKWIAEVRTNSA